MEVSAEAATEKGEGGWGGSWGLTHQADFELYWIDIGGSHWHVKNPEFV